MDHTCFCSSTLGQHVTLNPQWSYNERGRPLENPNLFNSKGFCLQLFTRENPPKKCSSSIMLCFPGSNSHKTLVKLEWQSSVPSMKNRGAPVNITAFPFIFWDPRLRGLPWNQKRTPLSFSVFLCICLSQAHTHTKCHEKLWYGAPLLDRYWGIRDSQWLTE